MALVRFLLEPANLEKLITAAIDIVVTLMNAIVNSAYLLVDAAITLILTLVEFLLAPERIQQMLEAGAKILMAIVEGLLSMMSNVDKAGKEFIDKLWEKLTSVDWASLGKGVIDGILGGLKSAWNTLSSRVSDAWDSLFGDKDKDVDVSDIATSSEEGFVSLRERQQSLARYNSPNVATSGSTVNVTQNIYSSAKTPSELMTEAYYQQKLGAMN
jgi:phage-related protein